MNAEITGSRKFPATSGMVLVLSVTSLCLVCRLSAQTNVAQVTGGTSGAAINLIDTSTGVSTQVHQNPTASYNGLAWSGSTNLLYFVDTLGTSNTFYSYDPANPSTQPTSLGQLLTPGGTAIASDIDGATINRTGDGSYLAVARDTAILYSWDLSGGVATGQSNLNLGSTGWSGLHLGDLAIDSTGALYISAQNINQNQSALLKYASVADAFAGVAPAVLNLSGAANQLINGLAFDPLTNNLYGYQVDNGERFYLVNKNTGTAIVGSVINNTDPAFATYGDLSDAFVVPEPSSALLIAVFGLFGIQHRRRTIRDQS